MRSLGCCGVLLFICLSVSLREAMYLWGMINLCGLCQGNESSLFFSLTTKLKPYCGEERTAARWGLKWDFGHKLECMRVHTRAPQPRAHTHTHARRQPERQKLITHTFLSLISHSNWDFHNFMHHYCGEDKRTAFVENWYADLKQINPNFLFLSLPLPLSVSFSLSLSSCLWGVITEADISD